MTRIRLLPFTLRQLSVKTSTGFVSLHRILHLHYTTLFGICQAVSANSSLSYDREDYQQDSAHP